MLQEEDGIRNAESASRRGLPAKEDRLGARSCRFGQIHQRGVAAAWKKRRGVPVVGQLPSFRGGCSAHTRAWDREYQWRGNLDFSPIPFDQFRFPAFNFL